MKKIFKLSVAAFAIMAAASCAKELNTVDALQQENPSTGLRKVDATFTVTLDETKGFVDGNLVKWEVGDSVKVYDDKAIAAYITAKSPEAGTVISPELDTFYVVSVDGPSAVISGRIHEGAVEYTAVYPFTAGAGVVKGTTAAVDSVAVTVPNFQVIPSGKTVDPAALVAVAKAQAGGTFTFSNVFSLLKFTVSKDNVSTVVFQGKPEETFVGSANVCLQGAGLAAGVSGSSDKLCINCEAGANFAKGDYYAAVLPATLPSGITFGCTDGQVAYAKSSTKSVTLKRNGGMTFGKVDDGTPLVSEIKTYEDLVSFAQMSNFYGTTSVVKLAADIDCGGPAKEWTSPNTAFQGTFDGQNHRIYNVSATTNTTGNGYAGLFGTLGIGKEYDPACLKNLCVGSKDYDFTTGKGTYDGVSQFKLVSQMTSGWMYAGVVPYLHNYATVDNVVNFANVTTGESLYTHRMGGIVGTMKAYATIRNCKNFGNISDCTTSNLAGAYTATIGGIVGRVDGAESVLSGCYNAGNVTNTSPFTPMLGGITAGVGYTATVENCVNDGNITQNAVGVRGSSTGYSVRTGGIIGIVENKTAPVIINKCTNNGVVSVTETNWSTSSSVYSLATGGVIGMIGAVGVTLKGLVNNGKVAQLAKPGASSAIAMGGLAGYVNKSFVADKAEDGTINQNTGEVVLDAPAAGTVYVAGGISYINNAVNDGTTISYVTNKGKIHVTDKNNTSGKTCNIGGVVANLKYGAVANCFNEGEIEADGSANKVFKSYIGGVVGGSGTITVSHCGNSGTVTVKKSADGSRVGGLCATVYATGTVSDSYNSGDVIEEVNESGVVSLVGGMSGYFGVNKESTPLTQFAGCTSTGNVTVSETTWAGNKTGAVVGGIPGSPKSTLYFGSAESPLYVAGTLKHGDTIINLDADNIVTYFQGAQNYGTSLFDTTNMKILAK